jgi:hypothetical protein
MWRLEGGPKCQKNEERACRHLLGEHKDLKKTTQKTKPETTIKIMFKESPKP